VRGRNLFTGTHYRTPGMAGMNNPMASLSI
jgi:hypothetical protein